MENYLAKRVQPFFHKHTIDRIEFTMNGLLDWMRRFIQCLCAKPKDLKKPSLNQKCKKTLQEIRCSSRTWCSGQSRNMYKL